MRTFKRFGTYPLGVGRQGYFSIMGRMAEMKDMYKLVKYIDSDEYDTPVRNKTSRDGAMSELVYKYSIKSGVAQMRVTKVLESALHYDYIKIASDHLSGSYFILTPKKGRQLVAKKWRIYPCGLVEQTMQVYPETHTFYKGVAIAIVGALATIMGAAIGAVITYKLSRP